MKRALGCALAVLATVSSPVAANAIRTEITTVSCSVTTACVIGTNAGTGPGVSGTGAKGPGISATGTSYGLLATSRTGTGVRSSAASNNAVLATNASSTSATVDAVQSGPGVALAGSSSAGSSGVTASSQNGIALTATSTSGIAVSANNPTNYPVFGNSLDETSIVAESGSGAGISAHAGPSDGRSGGLYTVTSGGVPLRGESSSGTGMGALTESGTSVFMLSADGNGVDASGSYIGVVGRSSTSGHPIVATDSNQNEVFNVDGDGDVHYGGTIGTYAHVTRGRVLAYGASATTPTVEDTGSSSLRSGFARIALDPAFARSIAGMGRYRVFLMANGETNGLYVAERDPDGFVVREARGGRGSIAFDYRVASTLVGHGNERTAFVSRSDERVPLPPVKTKGGPNGESR